MSRWDGREPTGRLPWRAAAGPLVVVTATLVGANVLAHRIVPGSYAAVSAGLVVVLIAVIRWCGLTARELGLARADALRGLRWGAVAAGAVVGACGLVFAVPALRDLVAPGGDSWPDVAVRLLVAIPLRTVLPEELAFRGVLWALLRRSGGRWTATLVSSVLFGLWHVLPALSGGPANASLAGAVGAGPVAVAARVVGTVLFTAVAGVLLCGLRAGSGSLLAPAALHWAANSTGAVLVKLVSG
jgi:CAAX protease family protein